MKQYNYFMHVLEEIPKHIVHDTSIFAGRYIISGSSYKFQASKAMEAGIRQAQTFIYLTESQNERQMNLSLEKFYFFSLEFQP